MKAAHLYRNVSVSSNNTVDPSATVGIETQADKPSIRSSKIIVFLTINESSKQRQEIEPIII